MIKISNFALGLIGLFLFFVMLSSLPVASTQKPVQQVAPTQTPIPATPVEFEPVSGIDALIFQDNQTLYQNDDPASVIVFYITVRKGSALENTNYTWEEVNSFSKWTNLSLSANDFVGKAEVILQIGDENGPVPGEFGYETEAPNGTIQIRGASSSASDQKSYKIELFDDVGTWRGQSTLPINKHIFDSTRIRNKLTFDLLKDIPHMVTLRTQFVRLFVKDETTLPLSSRFVDYGLFTQVEQINKTFLRNHSLDPNGHLYKATSFEFYRYAEQIRLETDPLYDESEFFQRLEVKGNRDHSKLIRMLEAVNNLDTPTTQVFETHFDADNYFTWMAFNILIGNLDTQNQNFYLYSPQNSEKWYFIPWDYDGDLKKLETIEFGGSKIQYFEVGVMNYWGVVLHNRVLKQEEYRLMLDAKIDEVSKLISPEKIEGMLYVYRNATQPYVLRPPDVYNLSASPSEYDRIFSLIPLEIENNRKLYDETLSYPMPFFMGVPEISNGMLRFNWDKSHNFIPQNITYRFLVSEDVSFNDIVFEAELLNVTNIETPIFEPGEYFWRVAAANEEGKVGYPFDEAFVFENGRLERYDAMKHFSITSEGLIGEAE